MNREAVGKYQAAQLRLSSVLAISRHGMHLLTHRDDSCIRQRAIADQFSINVPWTVAPPRDTLAFSQVPSMRRTVLIACFVLLPLLTGCSIVPDMLFGIFRDGYTGGGDTRAQKESHYNEQREPSGQHYKPWRE